MEIKKISKLLVCGLTALGALAQAQDKLFLGEPTKVLTGYKSGNLRVEQGNPKTLLNLINEPTEAEQSLILDVTKGRKLNDLDFMKASGGWTGNGGDGFACFDSDEIAKKAIDTNGVLIESYRNHIKSVSPRDLSSQQGASWPQIQQGEKALPYLERILKESGIHKVPYLESQFLTFLRSMINDDGTLRWKPVRGLAPISDQGFSASVHNYRMETNNCRLVQLVHRYEKNNLDGTVGLFFAADFDLLRRMMNPLPTKKIFGPEPGDGERAIAVLLLHEIAYSISSLSGSATSESARSFIGFNFKQYPYKNKNLSVDLTLPLSQFDSFYLSLNVSSNVTAFPSSTATWLKIRQQIFYKFQLVRDTYKNSVPGIYVELLLRGQELQEFNKKVYKSLTPEERWLHLAEFWYKQGLLPFSPDLFLLENDLTKVQDMKRIVCETHKKFGLNDVSVLALCKPPF